MDVTDSDIADLDPKDVKVTFYPGVRGYSIYPWVARCGAAPHILTQFKTNIADFRTLFTETEFRFFNTLFKTFNPNINQQGIVQILVFIVQKKRSCLKCPYGQNVFLGFHYLCNIYKCLRTQKSEF